MSILFKPSDRIYQVVPLGRNGHRCWKSTGERTKPKALQRLHHSQIHLSLDPSLRARSRNTQRRCILQVVVPQRLCPTTPWRDFHSRDAAHSYCRRASLIRFNKTPKELLPQSSRRLFENPVNSFRSMFAPRAPNQTQETNSQLLIVFGVHGVSEHRSCRATPSEQHGKAQYTRRLLVLTL
jgi:hypothetical protein